MEIISTFTLSLIIIILFNKNICEDEWSYERQDTWDTKFATKNQGFPYWDLHNHSINFSPPAQRGSQTILTISEYGCRTNTVAAFLTHLGYFCCCNFYPQSPEVKMWIFRWVGGVGVGWGTVLFVCPALSMCSCLAISFNMLIPKHIFLCFGYPTLG